MNRRDESRKAADAKRRKLLPWRAWYGTAGWRIRRDKQLNKTPWCEPCRLLGKTRKATACNHKVPHRGDRKLFDIGELESCCANCHSQGIQRDENLGYRRQLGDDGWPTDPAHPFVKASDRNRDGK